VEKGEEGERCRRRVPVQKHCHPQPKAWAPADGRTRVANAVRWPADAKVTRYLAKKTWKKRDHDVRPGLLLLLLAKRIHET
jgi:hypothetical protein